MWKYPLWNKIRGSLEMLASGCQLMGVWHSPFTASFCPSVTRSASHWTSEWCLLSSLQNAVSTVHLVFDSIGKNCMWLLDDFFLFVNVSQLDLCVSQCSRLYSGGVLVTADQFRSKCLVLNMPAKCPK